MEGTKPFIVKKRNGVRITREGRKEAQRVYLELQSSGKGSIGTHAREQLVAIGKQIKELRNALRRDIIKGFKSDSAPADKATISRLLEKKIYDSKDLDKLMTDRAIWRSIREAAKASGQSQIRNDTKVLVTLEQVKTYRETHSTKRNVSDAFIRNILTQQLLKGQKTTIVPAQEVEPTKENVPGETKPSRFAAFAKKFGFGKKEA